VVGGDDGYEAYTAIMWSGLLSRESFNIAEAETFGSVEGNMLCTVTRGATALPWSETPLRMDGRRRNLGDLISPGHKDAPGHDGKSRRRSRRGRGEESDDCILPVMPRTKPIRGSAAETAEGRRSVEGKVSSDACPGLSAGSGMSPKRRAYGSKHAWAAQAPTFDRV